MAAASAGASDCTSWLHRGYTCDFCCDDNIMFNGKAYSNGDQATMTCMGKSRTFSVGCCGGTNTMGSNGGSSHCVAVCPSNPTSAECQPGTYDLFWTLAVQTSDSTANPSISDDGLEKAVEPLSLLGQIRGRIEYESKLAADQKEMSKIQLALIVMFGFGFCGVDRCCAGSVCLGLIKGFTGGGLMIWGLIDYFLILFNCLTMKPELTSLGFNVKFQEGSIQGGMIVCAVFLGLKVISCVVKLIQGKGSEGRTKVQEEDPEYLKLAA